MLSPSDTRSDDDDGRPSASSVLMPLPLTPVLSSRPAVLRVARRVMRVSHESRSYELAANRLMPALGFRTAPGSLRADNGQKTREAAAWLSLVATSGSRVGGGGSLNGPSAMAALVSAVGSIGSSGGALSSLFRICSVSSAGVRSGS